jgi:hypothetical protein
MSFPSSLPLSSTKLEVCRKFLFSRLVAEAGFDSWRSGVQ